jgi:protein-disulfide isomerase
MARKVKKTRNSVNARKGPSANFILTFAVVVVAVAVIGGVLLTNRSDGATEENTGASSELRAGPDRNTFTTSDGDKATVVEFLDYQCPACNAYYHNITNKLETDYTGRITFVTRNFPLDAHPLAVPAARAAEAAAKQGKYREMYHQLYDNYQQWAIAPDGKQVSDDLQRATSLFDQYGTAIGLDLDRFHTDIASTAVQQRIDADRAAGEKLGVSSTPTIYVNGKQFTPQGDSFADADRQLRDTLDNALG